ncbi:MAG TPA: cupin domain-containing protein [Sphingobacterium sp.]|nr:cupin domain-containing protein [Sphingobacterium sp.]
MTKSVLSLLFGCLLCVFAHAQYSNDIVIETLMKADTTSIGQKILYPQVEHAEVTVFKITMQPGTSTGWHKHDIPLFAYILQGTLTVERENGERKQFTAGTAISEMRDQYHQGLNEGEDPLVLIAFYLGGDNKPLAIRKPNP